MYNQLPSQIVQNATTFDLMVLDVHTTWENFKADPESQTNYSESELLDMIKATRGE